MFVLCFGVILLPNPYVCKLKWFVGACFSFLALFCNGCLCFCCQIITYVSLNEFLVWGASQPTSRPARWDELVGWVFCVFHGFDICLEFYKTLHCGMTWLVFFCFCFVLFHGLQKFLLNFIKHDTRNDLRLVVHFVICFSMVLYAFAAKLLRM